MHPSIVHINYSDISGGAARAAYRLHKGLSQIGHESRMYTYSSSSVDPSCIQFLPAKRRWQNIPSLIRNRIIAASFNKYSSRPTDTELFSDCRAPYKSQVIKQIPDSEIINLHWIARFIDLHSFFAKINKPIVWTLHDMNPFTGGCHYTDGCINYMKGCGKCPQIGSSYSNDLSRHIWRQKELTYNSIPTNQLHIVAPSNWLANQARQSPLLGRFNVAVIPNGIDIEVFKPCNSLLIRDAFNISDSSKIILFSAESISNKRKGFHLLLEALKYLNDPNITLISMGNISTKLESPYRHINIGPISNDQLMAQIYSSADVFVIPSLEDNLPNTVLEAMACGTPIAGFSIGGIPDMVSNGINGMLASHRDTLGLADAISDIVNNTRLRSQMSKASRDISTHNYDAKIQAFNYSNLYNTALKPI